MMSLPGDLHEHHWEAGCGDTSDHSHSKSNAEGDLPHFAHLQQTTKVSKKMDYLKNLPFGYHTPLQVSVVFFSEVFGVFVETSHFSVPTFARSYVPQCWKPSSFSCSLMNIQLGTSTGTDSVELMDHGGNFRTWVSVFLFEFEWYEY